MTHVPSLVSDVSEATLSGSFTRYISQYSKRTAHKQETGISQKHLIDNRLQRRLVTLAVLYLKCSCVHELGPTFMPKVITVIIILKIKAKASCHSAVYRPSPAGRSAKLLPVPVSDVFVGCEVRNRE